MGIFFMPYQANSCSLCGVRKPLTGEHKIKASSIRQHFGKETEMVIGSFDGISPLRHAQGPKSKVFHFSEKICVTCNNTRSQGPDYEFDQLHAKVTMQISKGEDPASVFTLPRYSIGTEQYFNVFRYFAKLLCCHIAEVQGPRPIMLSRFALSKIDQNPLFLQIDTDPKFTAYKALSGDEEYAHHGGLIVKINPKTHLPISFYSSLSIGAARYKFWTCLNLLMGYSLKVFHYNFWKKCEAVYFEALENPLSDEERHWMGL